MRDGWKGRREMDCLRRRFGQGKVNASSTRVRVRIDTHDGGPQGAGPAVVCVGDGEGRRNHAVFEGFDTWPVAPGRRVALRGPWREPNDAKDIQQCHRSTPWLVWYLG